MKTNDWRYLTLGDVATIVGGGTPRKRVTDYWNGSVQWATPTDITALHGRKIDRTATTITDSGLAKSSATLLPPNSLLMTTRATIGACAINSIPMATNQGFQNLVPRPDTLVEFLYHLIQHHRRQLELVATGGTFLEVSRRALRDFRIVLPPVCEQRKIAAILSSVDDVIEKTRAVIGQLQIVNRSLTSELLNRGLPGDHTRFKRTVIGDVPEVWNVRTVAQSVAKLSAGKRYDKRTREENGNIPIIDQSERRFFGFHDNAPGVHASISAPVVTFANHTCAVRWHEHPFSVIQNVFPLQGAAAIGTRYLYHVLRGAIVSRGYKGHWPLLMRTSVPVPTEDEQIRICDIIDSVEDRTHTEIDLVSRLTRLKSSLSSALLIGDLRVTTDAEYE